MSRENSSKQYWWNPIHLVALFGRYQGDRRSESPHNALLVGREGQRSFLNDLLTERAGPGAYLITGHRGAGKTSFIFRCIENYRKDAFSRFVNSNVGRSVLWDRIGLALFGILAVLAGLVLFELIGMSVQQASSPPAWILLSPLLLLGAAPLLYSYRCIEAASLSWMIFRRTSKQDSEMGPSQGRLEAYAIALAVTVTIAVVSSAVLPLGGSHGYGLSLLFLGGSCAISTSRILFPIQRNPPRQREQRPGPRQLLWRVGLFTFVAAFTAWQWHQHLSGIQRGLRHQDPATAEATAAVVVGLVILGIGALGRSVLERSAAPRGDTVANALLIVTQRTFLGRLITSVLLLAMGAIAGLAWYRVYPNLVTDHGWLLGTFVLAATGTVMIANTRGKQHRLRDEDPTPDWTRPSAILLFKSFVAFVAGLQVLHPALAQVMSQLASPVPEEFKGYLVGTLLDPSVGAEALSWDGLAELTWGISLFSLVALIYQTEHEWVLVPFHFLRQDPAQDPRPRSRPLDRIEIRRIAHRQAHLTIPWHVMRAWLPVMVVSVNLGSERLPYAGIIRAMLVSLRERYSEGFVSFRSGVSITIASLVLVVATLMTSMVGRAFFDVNPSHAALKTHIEAGDPCTWSASRPHGEAAPPSIRMLCGRLDVSNEKLAEVAASRDGLIQNLYFDIMQTEGGTRPGGRNLLVCNFLPCETDGTTQYLHVRVYHLVIFLLLLVAFRVLRWFVPLLRYRRNLALIDGALDRLSARRTVIPPGVLPRIGASLSSLFGREHVKLKELDPEDVRTVEASFVTLIEELQSNRLALPWVSGHTLSTPAPEIIFVFDELDKVGVRVEPIAGRAAKQDEANQEVDAERQRSKALSRLLSEMKNLLSSTPAKFFFIGGRNLHDEWLADRTARLPLLTSIFKAEVYLPSLLADSPRIDHDDWLSRIRQYVLGQYRRACADQIRGSLSLRQPRVLQRRPAEPAIAFAAPPETEDEHRRDLGLAIHRDRGGAPLCESFVLDLGLANELSTSGVARRSLEAARDIERDLLRFLAYRSIGNPKRLRELLEGLLRLTARCVDHGNPPEASIRPGHRSASGMTLEARHSIWLSEPVRYRLQMLSETYGVLDASFADRSVHRDDKLAVSLFNLTDFLFRFHGRGFSWSNLERVDELVHIHRAHDHRRVLEDLVRQWLDRFLHEILNGMYDFRFRSDMAREIEYISRHSEEEMAALNFTLDESEPLKALYEANNARMGERVTPDALAALGELYEFDQEFELARSYYDESIRKMDATYARTAQQKAEDGRIWAALSSSKEGLDAMRRQVTWGIHRLRLTLQIGMTFEVSRHYERAALEYRNARTLGRVLLRAMLDDKGRFLEHNTERPPGASRRHVLKHMNIVFQAAFAEAWVAEKMPLGVDTSIHLIELELKLLRKMLPFVRGKITAAWEGHKGERRPNHSSDEPGDEESDDTDANFALTMAELHNKAGDLYFFKGRQVSEHSRSGRESKRHVDDFSADKGTEGYLLRAHDHYAMALHDIRAFVRNRRERSVFLSGKDRHETIERGGWSDYVYRLVGSNLCDLSESVIARISFFRILHRISQPAAQAESDQETVDNLITKCDEAMRKWVEQRVNERTEFPSIPGMFAMGNIEEWLGTFPGPRPVEISNIVYVEKKVDSPSNTNDGPPFDDSGRGDRHHDAQRLLFSLYSNCVAARMLRRAGYREDAARESMQIADVTAQFLWWANSVQFVATRVAETIEDIGPWASMVRRHWDDWKCDPCIWNDFWNHLIDLALANIEQAVDWFEKSRQSMHLRAEQKTGYRLGVELPPQLAVIACSVGLAGDRVRWSSANPASDKRATRMRRLLRRMVGPLWAHLGGDEEDFKPALRLLLRELFARHPYPMLTRLHAFKVTIDDSVLRDVGDEAVGGSEYGGMGDEELVDASLHLNTLAARFDAPMHFTSSHVGFSLANVWLRVRSRQLASGTAMEQVPLAALYRATMHHMNTSEELVTMRRAYYDTINRLHYLYDEFNDRNIHYNHALQMSALEVNMLLKHTLGHINRRYPMGEQGGVSMRAGENSVVSGAGGES